MIKELILHTGDCKTGSTSIQKCLSEGSWSVGAKTVCYPAAFNHIPLAKAMNNPDMIAERKRRFAIVRKRFLESDADVGIMSAEHFEFTDPENIAFALQEFMPEMWDKLRVLTYIRPHADRVLSTFAERTKQAGLYDSIDDLQAKLEKTELLVYGPRLRKWREIFGERHEVRAMSRNALRGGDVVDDFFGFVYPDQPATITMEAEANSSLCVEDLVYMKELHRRLRRRNPKLGRHHNLIGIEFGPVLAKNHRGKSTKLQIHRSVVEKVQAFYAADAAAVDAEFLGGTVMQDSLAGSHKKAIDEPISLKFSDYYTPRASGQLDAHAEFLLRMHKVAGPKFDQLIRNPAIRKREKKF